MAEEITEDYIWHLLEDVTDPEIPVLSLVDLGVIRKVIKINNNKWKIEITPTYTACPATQFMASDIKKRLKKESIDIEVQTILSPAWTSDWITEKGRLNLKEYGITPPQNEGDKSVLFGKQVSVPCPLCNSTNTKLVSQFGSTACKAFYKCEDCHEPFDYFKCHR